MALRLYVDFLHDSNNVCEQNKGQGLIEASLQIVCSISWSMFGNVVPFLLFWIRKESVQVPAIPIEQATDCNLRQGAGGMKIALNGSRTCFLR